MSSKHEAAAALIGLPRDVLKMRLFRHPPKVAKLRAESGRGSKDEPGQTRRTIRDLDRLLKVELRHDPNALGHGVLREVAGEHEMDGRLDVARSKRVPIVHFDEMSAICGNPLENVSHVRTFAGLLEIQISG
jgi:hypothetical protein